MSKRALALAVCLSLCASGVARAEPPKVSPESGPKAATPAKPARPKKGAKAFPPCRLFIGEIKDLRTDPGTMGAVGSMVYVDDMDGWVRTGFQRLVADNRFTLVETAEEAEVALKVDLIKSYIYAGNGMSKAATVVVRVHYTAGDWALGENVYRGGKSSVNWVGTSSESIGSLNISLLEAVEASKPDLLKGCLAVRARAEGQGQSTSAD